MSFAPWFDRSCVWDRDCYEPPLDPPCEDPAMLDREFDDEDFSDLEDRVDAILDEAYGKL